MSSSSRPISLVAERAVRLLQQSTTSLNSVRMAREVLATRTPDERHAKLLLESAFAGDTRLTYRDGGWRLTGAVEPRSARQSAGPEPDRSLLVLQGQPPRPGSPFELRGIAALRLREDQVVSACGGDVLHSRHDERLRRRVLEILEGAVPVVHDPPGGLRALDRWLGEPLRSPISLRRLGQRRLRLRADHDLRALAAKLGLDWRDVDDPLELAEVLDGCLQALRRPGESLMALQTGRGDGPTAIDWSRFGFDRELLDRIPRVPGTYRFYDAAGKLLYVGKSNDLSRRIRSYFYDTVGERSSRVRGLLDRLYRIEFTPSGSGLEAMLREARQIRTERPTKNVQRRVRVRRGRSSHLLSVLILEPAEPPSVLRAYLIRNRHLVARVNIGARGGGLKRIRRILEARFFDSRGPVDAERGPDLDLEVVARWLAANREHVVAFDPTDLKSADEVIERLRWFLRRGGPFDSDGSPVHPR